jgi:histidine triad (HIT) family protein
MRDKNCIFCKISAKEIPAEIIYEDEDFLAFLDVNPAYFGHTLLIPKEHYVWMQETPDQTIGRIFVLAKKIMLAIKKGLAADYVVLSVVGNEVPHFHIHLIPRGKDNTTGRKTYTCSEQKCDYAEKIKSNL